MDADRSAVLKSVRARKLGSLTRSRRRAFILIDNKGSKTQLTALIGEIDEAFEAVEEAHCEFVNSLVEEEEIKQAQKYLEQVEQQHGEAIERIKDHLASRRDEAPSVAASLSKHSEASGLSTKSRNADIEARIKELKLQQLERKLEQEKEEMELQQRRKKQEAQDELEAAKLEASLRKAAVDELSWERRDDFVGEEGLDDIDVGGRPAKQSTKVASRDRNAVEEAANDQAEVVMSAPSKGHVTEKEAQISHDSCTLFSKSLPRINVPVFDGNPIEWPKWYGIFRALVHNQACLTDAEKMMHLQASVSGLAAQCINGMLFDPALYGEAVRTLKERFGQEETVVHANLNAVFSATSPSYTNAASLERYHALVNSAVVVLQNLGYTGDLESSENLKRAVEKLPMELRRSWGEQVLNMAPERPSLVSFNCWLKRQVKISLNCARGSDTERRQVVRRTAMTTTAPHAICAACGEGHQLEACACFLAMLPDDRAQLVASRGLCFFCFADGHRLRFCPSAAMCGRDGCLMRHHDLLHGSRRILFRDSGRAPARQTSREPEAAQRTVASALPQQEETTTLLQLVQVRVHGQDGRYRDVCALIDPGAQTSLCCRDVLEELGIQGKEKKLVLQNVEGAGEEQTSLRVALELSALKTEDSQRIYVPEAFGVTNINVEVPNIPASEKRSWHHVRDLDIPNLEGCKVELLLGANVVETLLQLEARVGNRNQPVAIKTAFGWTLTGTIKGFVPERTRQVLLIHRLRDDNDMHQMVQDWWTTEAFGIKFTDPSSKSVEDARALGIMETTTKYLGGRFETGLLWKKDAPILPDNKAVALRRLQMLEKRLQRRPDRASTYAETLKGYVESGHARKLSPEEVARYSPVRWYLPHHAVLNPHKPGKVRVVFDAAATCKGTSLNDQLLSGPDLLLSLPGVLMRFREEKIALVADVKQMYHQVRVREKDQPALSFMWRDLDQTREPDVFQMMVTIFGARSSPASANFVLRKTAADLAGDSEEERRAANAVLSHFYMDDFLKSERDIEDAKAMQVQLTDLLQRGGFCLTKWKSNCKQVLESVSEEHRAHSDLLMPTESLLGYMWNPQDDTLSLRTIDTDVAVTKRGVVKAVARLFDPLGLMCPLVVRAKILVQRLWVKGYGWDDPLDDQDEGELLAWLREVGMVDNFQIPRCYKSNILYTEEVQHELHVFGDASEKAFGAVAYMKTTDGNGSSQVLLVMAKSRVAPLKKISIVRLELQAAVMAIRIANAIRDEHQYALDRVIFWTDSQVVLKYLQSESHRFHTFIANRVTEIKEASRPQQWRYVPSAMNPADACSRGERAERLTRRQDWACGPLFLLGREESWPPLESGLAVHDLQGDPEVRTLLTTGAAVAEPSVLPEADKYSSWKRYCRVVGWMKRFVRNFVAKYGHDKEDCGKSGPLSAAEIKAAELLIVSASQKQHYPDVVDALSVGSREKKDHLSELSPFLDSSGIMRVGGRLEKAPLPFETQHPVILHPKDPVTRLIIMHAHVSVLHAGLERTLTEVRSTYWITKGRAAVKQVIHKCATCIRRRATPRPPLMSSLPKDRFDCTRPFNKVGIDYFGPLMVKRLRKTEKRYGVLITCLSTRAVHLEVAHSLEADGLILALRRFFARRGKPSVIYSDNGTNMVGGERELRESLQELDTAQITDKLSHDKIEWKFIPPSSPHMGGAWERMVGSVKRALRAISSGQCWTDEVLLTLLAEVESMLNGRPLTYLSSDSRDPEPLTPNHFLVGCANPNVAPGVFQDKEICSRRRWRQVQVLSRHFWNRWRREFLPSLVRREKWWTENQNLMVGDVVLMKEDDTPRGFWPLARVVKVIEGSDGRVRSVELKAASGVYHRPVAKVCLLEQNNAGG